MQHSPESAITVQQGMEIVPIEGLTESASANPQVRVGV